MLSITIHIIQSDLSFSFKLQLEVFFYVGTSDAGRLIDLTPAALDTRFTVSNSLWCNGHKLLQSLDLDT